MTLGLPERIESKISPEPNSGCWLWTAALDRYGYGRIGIADINCCAHRVVFEFFRGPQTTKKDLDHLCKNPACCNPDHLELVTRRVNILRGKKGHITHCSQGHEYTKENSIRIQSGSRICRICRDTSNKNRRLPSR